MGVSATGSTSALVAGPDGMGFSADRWARSYDRPMVVDVQFRTGNSSWAQLRDAVVVAEDAGFDAVWVLDHLSGAVFGGGSMFECFTQLGAFAAVTSRI